MFTEETNIADEEDVLELVHLNGSVTSQPEAFNVLLLSPSLSVRHVSALLKLKTNLSRSDRRKVKDTLTVTLSESAADHTPAFFSSVLVK